MFINTDMWNFSKVVHPENTQINNTQKSAKKIADILVVQIKTNLSNTLGIHVNHGFIIYPEKFILVIFIGKYVI